MTVADDYTPTTEEVREAIAEWAWSRRMFRPELGQSDGKEGDRWLAGHDAEVRAAALAEQGEPEWEWKVATHLVTQTIESPVTDEETARVILGWTADDGLQRELHRRRKAGPWLPVPDSTNHESEEQP